MCDAACNPYILTTSFIISRSGLKGIWLIDIHQRSTPSAPRLPPPLPFLHLCPSLPIPIPSHKILLIEPLLITPAPLGGPQILVSALPPRLVLAPLTRHLLLLFGAPLALGPLLGPLPREVGLFGGGEAGGREGFARLFEAVDGGVVAGWGEVFFGLGGGEGREGISWGRKRGGG